MNLKAEQQKLYGLLPPDARCFVRICDDDRALWVSDLPRRHPDCGQLPALLDGAGFAVQPDEKTGLWYVDWTEKRWQEMLDELPRELPPLPQKEEYHEVYALCRLFLLHPARLAPNHLPTLRRAIKLTAQKPEKMLRSVRALHEEAAVQMRRGQALACDAGRILAAWLHEQIDGKET